MEKKLYRSRTDKKICGVCAGIAKYLNVDVTVIRVATVILTLAGCSGLLIYLVCALIMPEEPDSMIESA